MRTLRKRSFTDIGLVIHRFCAEQLVSKKELAHEAGVSYDTLLQLCKGRTAGHEATPKIEAAMQRIKQDQANH